MRSRNVCSLAGFPLAGRGGGRCPAKILGLSCNNVRKGRLELSTATWRYIGFGDLVADAHQLKKTIVVARLLKLIQPEITAIPWGLLRTRRSLSKLTVALPEDGIKNCPTTVK